MSCARAAAPPRGDRATSANDTATMASRGGCIAEPRWRSIARLNHRCRGRVTDAADLGRRGQCEAYQAGLRVKPRELGRRPGYVRARAERWIAIRAQLGPCEQAIVPGLGESGDARRGGAE